MKPKIVTGWTAVLAVLVATGPLLAHHSVGVFETTTPIRVKGTVVRFAWANPHSAIIVEQRTGDGAIGSATAGLFPSPDRRTIRELCTDEGTGGSAVEHRP